MGRVYVALDPVLDRKVALKVIHLPRGSEALLQEARKRLHKEAKAAATIQHENVVAIHDFGTDAQLDVDYIVYELLEGQDLAARLKEPPRPSLEEALQMILQAAAGVSAGHRRSVLHRDLKPSNLFLVKSKSKIRLKVVDFGIARSLDAAGENLTQHGHPGPFTPAYASPEQFHDSANLGLASDVFSLGVVAFEVLTGERPYTVPQLWSLHSQPTAPLNLFKGKLAAVPTSVGDVILRALLPKPEQRFPDAQTFYRALQGAVQQAAPSPPPSGPPEDPVRKHLKRWLPRLADPSDTVRRQAVDKLLEHAWTMPWLRPKIVPPMLKWLIHEKRPELLIDEMHPEPGDHSLRRIPYSEPTWTYAFVDAYLRISHDATSPARPVAFDELFSFVKSGRLRPTQERFGLLMKITRASLDAADEKSRMPMIKLLDWYEDHHLPG